jgi:hypothetical protein
MLRRMLYLVLKELSPIAEDVIIVISSLTKDMNSDVELYRANSIRVLCHLLDNVCVILLYVLCVRLVSVCVYVCGVVWCGVVWCGVVCVCLNYSVKISWCVFTAVGCRSPSSLPCWDKVSAI